MSEPELVGDSESRLVTMVHDAEASPRASLPQITLGQTLTLGRAVQDRVEGLEARTPPLKVREGRASPSCVKFSLFSSPVALCTELTSHMNANGRH